jgi:hypothetical protein
MIRITHHFRKVREKDGAPGTVYQLVLVPPSPLGILES